jgi:phage repressor protein C with HTH and peptisase S24 domain
MVVTDPRERLFELAGERSVSLAQLSALIGRNSSYLQQFVRKGSPRKLEEGDRAKLARFFAVSEAELGGSEEKSSETDWVDVPRLALGASAGPGAVPQEEQAVGAFRFSRRWLRQQGLDSRSLSAIAVDGDSMEPVLRDGDEILVDTTLRPLRDGVHVVRVGEVLLVKRLETGRPGLVVLKSDNPAYDPIALAPCDVEVVGRVVWKAGRL